MRNSKRTSEKVSYSGFDKPAIDVAKIKPGQTAVKRWAKVVGFVVIVLIAAILIAPDIDLQPTVSRITHIPQKPSATVVQSVAPAILTVSLLIAAALSLHSPPHATNGSFASVIDLTCSRLC